MSSLDSLKIVSIGGGANTGELLKLSIDLVGKESKKKALVIPTARPNPEGATNTYKNLAVSTKIGVLRPL